MIKIKGLILSLIFLFAAVGSGVSAEPLELKPSEDGIQRAEIVVDTYSYKPDHLIVVAGKPVELTLKSVTIIVPHNFVIKAPEIGVEINQEVRAGKTVKVQFTPMKEGKVEIYCDKKLLFFKSHKEKGMLGTLEVRGGEENPSPELK
ncbi:MAG: cupredoxin domain-containing protein [Nitrospirae bacterium]|nr:cupredoxin domain-containing protein [Nitrospirota bacterium]